MNVFGNGDQRFGCLPVVFVLPIINPVMTGNRLRNGAMKILTLVKKKNLGKVVSGFLGAFHKIPKSDY